MPPHFDPYLSRFLAHVGIDTGLPREELRDALLAAIAEQGGVVAWSSSTVRRPTRAYVDERGVAIASVEEQAWRVEMSEPYVEVCVRSSLEEALASCLASLRDPLQNFYRELDAFLVRFRAKGHVLWAERIDWAVRSGSMGSEILGALRWELHATLRGNALLDQDDRRWVTEAIQRVNRFLGPTMPDPWSA